MSVRRQNNQLQLAFPADPRSEAERAAGEGTEAFTAERPPTRGPTRGSESPADSQRLMEATCEPDNLRRALKRVCANGGGPGVDGMTVTQLPGYLKAHWPTIREQLLDGAYRPQPVKRVEIPKPGGGVRQLGIPTVLDRFIQQAMLQVLQPIWEPTFSERSYGFRPNRSAHQAVAQAQAYIAEGRPWVVDIDLEKFFDRVNHDMLMARVARKVSDKRALKVIRAYLNAGVMENGLVSQAEEGTPQGGPLSPLLSNIVLDDLDKELEKRGHAFVRYADDCNIYVRSERAGQRVMEGVTDFITRKLRLKVNSEKSAVDRPSRRKFLGFSFTAGKQPKRRIAPQSVKRFKARVRELTRRTRGVDARRMIEELAVFLRGWIGYFGFCQTPSVLRELDSWIRRRLRAVAWKQWKRGRTRFRELTRRGVSRDMAAIAAAMCQNPWRASKHGALHTALPNALWIRLGLPTLTPQPPA
jgi:RNA-directed DNA polymerase